MNIRAAVAFHAAKPLEIVELDLDGPKPGEVLVKIKTTGVCQAGEVTLSGAGPEGLLPAMSAPPARRAKPTCARRSAQRSARA